MTAGSYLIALLHETLSRVLKSNTPVLTFFYGINTVANSETELSRQTFMARAILAQLLALECLDRGDDANGRTPLLFLTLGHVKAMQENCYENYVTAIKLLILALRPRYNALSIIVDSIDFYDRY
jgi:hypothetical protein